MEAFKNITDGFVALMNPDIDTDQILPARFLACTDDSGLGGSLFYDKRFAGTEEERSQFPLNAPQYQGESILLTGVNFGCGSSREHAPWALRDFGIKVIIGSSFGEIFESNCSKNGILLITLAERKIQSILNEPKARLSVDLEKQILSFGNEDINFTIDPFVKVCLAQGMDELDFIFSKTQDIAAFEGLNGTRFPSTQSII